MHDHENKTFLLSGCCFAFLGELNFKQMLNEDFQVLLLFI